MGQLEDLLVNEGAGRNQIRKLQPTKDNRPSGRDWNRNKRSSTKGTQNYGWGDLKQILYNLTDTLDELKTKVAALETEVTKVVTLEQR